jgi:membrane protein
MRRLIAVFRAAGIKFSQDGCGFLAQAVAFNALFAIFPILVLVVSALSIIYGRDQAHLRALALVESVAPNVQNTLTENLYQIHRFHGISDIVALVTLIWSGKNLFMGLAYALDRSLNIPNGRSLPMNIVVALIILPIVGLLLLIATVLPIVISFVIRYGGYANSAAAAQVIGYGTATALVFAITLLLYTYLPSRRPHAGFGLSGAFFTAICWEAAQIAFGVYTTHVNFLQVYGAVSAIVVLLLWFYFMGVIFLFGAELSAQLGVMRFPPPSDRADLPEASR